MMIMQHALMHLVATCVPARVDTVEMEETVQVCAEYIILLMIVFHRYQ